MELSVVMDTNVLISGVLWRGVPFSLLKWVENGKLIVFSSRDILSEVYRVLHYPKFQQYIKNNDTSPGELFEKLASLCSVIQVNQEVYHVCSDPDDEKFLSCALAANAKVLISGDNHLLELKEYQSIHIRTAREFYMENIHKIEDRK